jgi:hypothetical protein
VDAGGEHVAALRRYRDEHPSLPPFQLNTFGFGYNLDSGLLQVIAA